MPPDNAHSNEDGKEKNRCEPRSSYSLKSKAKYNVVMIVTDYTINRCTFKCIVNKVTAHALANVRNISS